MQLVLHVGSLGRAQETTLQALAALQESDAQRAPTVAFIGTGPGEPRLRDLCHELGVQEHVLWLGFRTNVAPYLAAADVLALPAGGNDVPHVVLEAMAHGLPVIASNASGASSAIEDGVDGLLVPPEDPAALAGALQRLLGDASLSEALGRHALQSVRTHWSLDAMLDDLESLVYAHLLRKRQPRARPALFLDRDGTVVDNVPYNPDPAQVELVPGVARALRWVREAGVPMIVVSNQSGVARGLFTEEDVQRVNARVRELLRDEGADVDAIYFCTHHPDHGPPCACRKPEPGLLLRAAQLHGIDLTASLMVGDEQRDLEAGARAGTQRVGFVRAKETRIADTERVYQRWTALVRDYLRALHAGSLLELHVGDASTSAREAVPTRSE
jgi:histidinol-phosphate phosphatase family protein